MRTWWYGAGPGLGLAVGLVAAADAGRGRRRGAEVDEALRIVPAGESGLSHPIPPSRFRDHSLSVVSIVIYFI